MKKLYVLTLNGDFIGTFKSKFLAIEAMNDIINKYPNSKLSADDFVWTEITYHETEK